MKNCSMIRLPGLIRIRVADPSKEGKPKGSRYPLYRVGLFTMAPKPISDLELEKASRAGLTTKGVATEDHPPLLDLSPRR